jgi:nitric oxide reductase NorQ protein
MYLYLNLDDTPAAFMPSNRGRSAKNHVIRDVCGVDVSVNRVDIDALSDVTSAEAVKECGIRENGVWELDATDVGDAVVLHALLTVMQATLNNPMYVKNAAAMKRLLDEAASTPEAVNAEWMSAASALINANKRVVNSIMNDRARGWFHTDTAEEASSTVVVAAPEKKTEEKSAPSATVESTGYGFSRMVGEKPTLMVHSEEEVLAEEHGVFYPKPDTTYIINKSIEGLFTILETSSKNCPQNVNLIGPHGCGKTELAIQFAARHKRPLLIMDCANLREARDWFGYKSAREGTVFWHESQFVRAVQAGGHVILLDELNRANPNLLNTLMPILDARRFTYLEEKGDKIIVGPETVFFASMNEGAGYTGTSALDRAIRDRFPRAVELTYLAAEDEIKLLVNRTGVNKDIATRLVQLANKIRQDATGLSATLTESMSTRQLIAAAHDFALGGVDTLTFTITNHFSPDGDEDSERVKVQSIIQGKFGDMIAAQAAVSKGA